MTSPPRWRATATPRSDFPAAVGPTTATTGGALRRDGEDDGDSGDGDSEEADGDGGWEEGDGDGAAAFTRSVSQTPTALPDPE
jgi:hypothetical protein